jgi:demethylmenaquinone methyltransferase/2-methoxy-6-polyprenyl-1,4-benzoquinol methylase
VDYRVEQLAAAAGTSVDTIRFYQAKGLLGPPRRVGRVALYDEDHLERLRRIRALQAEGLSLAVIGRILEGRLGAADAALARAVVAEREREGTFGEAGGPAGPEEFLTLAELAARASVPVALLQALEAEGVLVPRRHEGEARYTPADLAALRAGLTLLEHGLPLSAVLELARIHRDATLALSERVVAVFDEHVRRPLQGGDGPEERERAAERLVEAFRELLPATVALVAHHFRRILLSVAQSHIEAVGAEAERRAVAAEAARRLEEPLAGSACGDRHCTPDGEARSTAAGGLPEGQAKARRTGRRAEARLPEGQAKARLVREMFDAIAPRYDLLNRLMTLGLDQGWRRRAVAALGLRPGAVVADLCCGTGDLSELARRSGFVPVPLAAGSVEGVVCGFGLRNVVDLAGFLAEAARVLRPGGRLALLEMGEPSHPLVRLGHRVHLATVVPLLGALLSDAAAYRYLPRSLAYLPPPAQLQGMVEEAGFEDVRRAALSGGVAQVVVGTRR